MYPREFAYHRAHSLPEAAQMLAQLGEEARVLAGGQSLIPLMKLRLANPAHIVDLNFIPNSGYIHGNGALRIGPLARHAQIERAEAASRIPILHDCAAGIADPQIRHRGTLAGSLAEADPTGDWAPVLLTLETQVRCLSSRGERTLPLPEFLRDAFTTALAPDELIQEVTVQPPPARSGGAYIAFKRCAPVYASASAAVQLTLADAGTCADARIVLGAVGLLPVRAREAEAALRGKPLEAKTIAAAAEAAMTAADPQSDLRGSADYKRVLVGALVKEAIAAAAARARRERVEVGHHYA